MKTAASLLLVGSFAAASALLAVDGAGASTTPPPTDPPSSAPPDSQQSTSAPPTTAAPIPLPDSVHNAACVVAVQPGESISLISDQTGVEIGVLQEENGIGDDHVLRPGDLIDTCAGNEIDDITGETRVPPDIPLPGDVHDPACVRIVQEGDSISLIADRTGAGISAIQAENSLAPDSILRPGELLDVCPGNEIDDVSGASRLRPPTTLIPDADSDGVRIQQQKLSELFAPLGMNELAVDGISGPLTRQQLCAARAFLGVPISRSDMASGSDEEAKLLALTSLPLPPVAPTDAERWVLVDMTCQVLIAGDGNGVRFVFPTSTGSTGFETRSVGRVAAFRFDPALDNGGWHDSSEFPVAYDNPLNGNMYKPIYFSNGQAIHGANNVPLSPASKGCVRLSVEHQDQLIAWLGLDTATDVVWRESTINLRVTTQGGYVPDP